MNRGFPRGKWGEAEAVHGQVHGPGTEAKLEAGRERVSVLSRGMERGMYSSALVHPSSSAKAWMLLESASAPAAFISPLLS